MTGEVRIENLNIGNVIVGPGAADGLQDFLEQEARRGVDPSAMADAGNPPVEVEIPETDEERAEAGEALAKIVIRDERARAKLRKKALELVIKEVDKSSNMGGFLVSHDADPDDPETVATIHAEKWEDAEESLELACANCWFQDNCKMNGNLDLWLDIHPYKDSDKPRPGSTYVRQRESRLDLIGAIREDPNAHCDPKKREPAKKKAA